MQHYVIGDVHGGIATLKSYNLLKQSDTLECVEIQENYANIDTGCYVKKEGYGTLSAFCIQTQEVVSVQRRE
ncbi:MAG: hypothetical protein OEL19_03605 [Sulfurimonas sp.]|nr:hypothetical protein [Sulfurimonas sp.]